MENKFKLGSICATVFLISASLLMLEVLFTRASKVAFGNDFRFILLSFAILGIGLGGMLVYFSLGTRWFSKNYVKLLGIFILIYSFSLVLPFLALHYFVQAQLLAKILFFVLTLLSYFIWGIYISYIFASYAKNAALIYSFSLAGSALGAFLIIQLLDAFGTSKTIIITFSISLLSAFSFIFSKKLDLKAAIYSITLILFLFFALSSDIYPYFDIVCYDMPKPEFSDTNSFSQIDAYKMKKNVPYLNVGFDELPDSLKIYQFRIDCIGTTTFWGYEPETAKLLEKSTKRIVLDIKNHSKVLIVGSGAGTDVAMSVAGGVGNVTAVEINPLIIKRVKKLTENRDPLNIYNDKSVSLFIDEARNFISKSDERYDLIFIPGSKRYGGTGVSSYAFLENYLYTQEALELYISHLNKDGVVAIADFKWFVLRYLENSILFMEKYGIGTEGRIALIDKPPYSILIMKKDPFTIEEKANLKSSAYRQGMDIRFLDQNGIKSFAMYAIPITDNHPFYWNKYSLINIFDPDKIKWERFLSFKNEKFISLEQLFILIFLIALVLVLSIAAPLFINKDKNPRKIILYLAYFTSIGTAFIMFELTFIQKFTLFVEKPVYALSIILAAVLLFSGIGSYHTPRISKKIGNFIPKITLVLSIIIFLYIFGLEQLFNQINYIRLPLKIAISIMLVAMPSFFMGMYFPFGLGKVNKLSNRLVSWMWGINGIASALGGVLSMIISLLFGFNAALIVGTAFYIMAAAAIRK